MARTTARRRRRWVPALMIALLLLPALPPAVPPAAAADTFVVTSAADPGTGGCDAAECTLREAIAAANNNDNQPAVDLIHFRIPGKGVQTIRPASGFPTISEPVTIDGYTQPGARPNTRRRGTNARPRIELDGSQAGSIARGLVIRDAADVTVRGLVVNRFGAHGISALLADRLTIVGTFIGTDATGKEARPNDESGVSIDFLSDGRIGGEALADRNLISGNETWGVRTEGAVRLAVVGNLIGTDRSGRGGLGNGEAGVGLSELSDDSILAGNVIACNGGGIVLEEFTDGVRLDRNALFRNGGGGIALDGGNRGQQAPDLTKARFERTGQRKRKRISVTGTLSDDPATAFVVQFFVNPGNNPDQGRRFLGELTVTPDGSGNADFTFAKRQRVRAGQAITATATDDATGDTSEFSAPVFVTKRGPSAAKVRNTPPIC